MSKNNDMSISDAWNKSIDNGQRVVHQQRQKNESLETAINNTRENVLDHLGERDKGLYRPDTNYYFELKDGGALKRQRLDEGYTSAQIDLARTLMQETGMSREQALSHIERGGGRYDAPLPVQGKHDIEVSTKAHDFLQGGKGIHRDVPILSPAEEDALRQQGGQGAVDAAGRVAFDRTTEPPAVSSRKAFGHGTRAELVAADKAQRKALEDEIEAATPSSGERARAIGTDTPEGLGVGVGPGGRDPDVGQHTAAQGSFPPSPDRPRRPSEKADAPPIDTTSDSVRIQDTLNQLTSPTLVHPDAIAQGRPLTQADRDALIVQRTAGPLRLSTYAPPTDEERAAADAARAAAVARNTAGSLRLSTDAPTKHTDEERAAADAARAAAVARNTGAGTPPKISYPPSKGHPLTQAARDRAAAVARNTGADTPPVIKYPPSKGHPFSQAVRDRTVKANQHRIEQEKKLMSKNREDLEGKGYQPVGAKQHRIEQGEKKRKELKDKGYQPVGESVEIMTDKEKAQQKIKYSIELINLAEETDEEKATRLQQWKRKLPELQQKRRDSKKAELIRRQENLADPIIIPKFGSGGRRITDPQTMRAYEERRRMRYGRNIERGLAELEAQNTAAAAAAADRDAQSWGKHGEDIGTAALSVPVGAIDLGIGILQGLGLPESILYKYRWLQSKEERRRRIGLGPEEAPSAAPEAPTGDDDVPSTPDTGDTSRSAAHNWGLKPDTPVGPPDDPNGTKDDDTAVSVAAIQAAIAAAKQKKSPFGSVGSTPVQAKHVGPLKWSNMRLKPETKKIGPSYRPPTPSYKARYA